MKIETFKDLEKLIKLCKKTNIYNIKIDNIEINISQIKLNKKNLDTEVFPEEIVKIPIFKPVASSINDNPSTPDKIETDELTNEQLLYYSSADKLSDEAQ